MRVGRNPRVVSYERSFGPSASYYAWEAAGRPVHGVKGSGKSEPCLELGVEEELLFVDAETLEVAPGFSRVVGEGDDARQARALRELRRADDRRCCRTRRRARRAPASAGGDRASARPGTGWRCTPRAAIRSPPAHDQEIVPLPRYEQMAKSFGDAIWRQLVCGLHVHVSVDDPRARLRGGRAVAAGLARALGELALSRVRGHGSAFGAGRARCCHADRRDAAARPDLGGLAGGDRGDSTRRHWDAWPRPEYGTLEVRVMDMQTDVAAYGRLRGDRAAPDLPVL